MDEKWWAEINAPGHWQSRADGTQRARYHRYKDATGIDITHFLHFNGPALKEMQRLAKALTDLHFQKLRLDPDNEPLALQCKEAYDALIEFVILERAKTGVTIDRPKAEF